MEIWFWLAIASAITGGLHAFTHKVVAARNSDINVLNVYASVISATTLLICALSFGNLQGFFALATLLAAIGAVTYLLTLVLKVESLKLIDSALFFPIYKVTGPLFAIVLGIIFFSESFTITEWIGLGISLMVPLMLITKSEHMRQKNLIRGVFLLLVASVIGSASIAIWKLGVDIAPNIWLYVFISDVFLVMSSVLVLLRKHKTNVKQYIVKATTPKTFKLVVFMGLTQAAGGATILFAFAAGGSLGIVYTINSLYILIPIILSIIFYNEHWNARKVVAIILSIAALGLLG